MSTEAAAILAGMDTTNVSDALDKLCTLYTSDAADEQRGLHVVGPPIL